MGKEKLKVKKTKTAPLMLDVFEEKYGLSKTLHEQTGSISDKTELVVTMMSDKHFGPTARTNNLHPGTERPEKNTNHMMDDGDEEVHESDPIEKEAPIEGKMAQKIFNEVQKMKQEQSNDESSFELDAINVDLQHYKSNTHEVDVNEQQFMKPSISMSTSDRILEKIREKESRLGDKLISQNEEDLIKKLDPRIVRMYKKIGGDLQRYRSGKFPKAMRILPSLQRWEEALYFSKPDKWSYQALHQATRIFTSGTPDAVAQRFFFLVLLPRFRVEMEEAKKLNFHVYEALKRACFKPIPFFKGIVIPLCEEGNATKMESVVIGSIIKKKGLPLEHSAAAIMMITSIEYNATYDSILKAFIEKRYALPNMLLDSLIDDYFLSFLREERTLPLVWYQVLLAFVQIYKNELSRDQKKKILAVCRKHSHHRITPTIRYELSSKQ